MIPDEIAVIGDYRLGYGRRGFWKNKTCRASIIYCPAMLGSEKSPSVVYKKRFSKNIFSSARPQTFEGPKSHAGVGLGSSLDPHRRSSCRCGQIYQALKAHERVRCPSAAGVDIEVTKYRHPHFRLRRIGSARSRRSARAPQGSRAGWGRG